MARIAHVRRAVLAAVAAVSTVASLGTIAAAGATSEPGADASLPDVAAPETTSAAPVDQTIRYPLTALEVPDPASYTPRPAVVVKIDNVNAQPQAGLNEADIVYEEIVESATRFAAVFNSTDSDPVGPIRSGRVQDIHLLGSFIDPVFAYSGANPGVNRALRDTGWHLIEAEGMWRQSGRRAPHNLFGNTSDFFARATDSAPAVPQFEYGQESGDPVTAISLEMAGRDIEWAWNADDELFYRSVNGRPHETTTGQFTTNNVVVLMVEYGRTAHDGNPEARTIGSGTAVVYAGGRKTVGTWTRAEASDTFALVDGAGETILLRPGRTVVHLARVGASVVDDAAA